MLGIILYCILHAPMMGGNEVEILCCWTLVDFCFQVSALEYFFFFADSKLLHPTFENICTFYSSVKMDLLLFLASNVEQGWAT